MNRRLLSRIPSKLRKLKSAAAANVRRYVGTAWLRSLFPHAGPPDEFEHRLQRISAEPLDVNGRQGGEVVCRFIYPEIDGSIQAGDGKIFLPPALKERPGLRVPLLHMAGYEIDAAAALEYLEEGLAVSTVHGHPLNVLSRGPKLEWALMHAMRRLDFVDDARVLVKGASSGGNMALLAAAETFPLACAMPMVPLVNLSYNFSYYVKSKTMAFSHRADSAEPWLPILASVTALPEQAAERFGNDFEAPAYFELSPVRLVDYITAPVLAVFSTGDVLVPLDQIGAELIRPLDAADFPVGFTRDMSRIVERADRRVRLLDAVPSDSRQNFIVPLPPKMRKKKTGGKDLIGRSIEVPFSRSRQWSIAVIDDGAPEPSHSHFKYYIVPDFAPFRRWALASGIQEQHLTPSKLVWLMKRCLGVQPLDFEVAPGRGAAFHARLLDFPQAERADVLRGLFTFARSDAAAFRLAELYAKLPESLKGLGETLGTGSPSSVRQALAQAAAANEARRSRGLKNRPRNLWTRQAAS